MIKVLLTGDLGIYNINNNFIMKSVIFNIYYILKINSAQFF